MSWHKIIFSDEQIINHEVVNFRRRVQNFFVELGAPEDFCVLKELTTEGERSVCFVYFSEMASEYCTEIIKTYGGKSCDRPILTEDFSPFVGGKSCLARTKT